MDVDQVEEARIAVRLVDQGSYRGIYSYLKPESARHPKCDVKARMYETVQVIMPLDLYVERITAPRRS